MKNRSEADRLLHLTDIERHIEYSRVKATLAANRIHAVDDKATVIVFGSLGREIKKITVPELHTFGFDSDIDLGIKPGQSLECMADYWDYRSIVVRAVQDIDNLRVTIFTPLIPLGKDRPGFLQEVERDKVVFP